VMDYFILFIGIVAFGGILYTVYDTVTHSDRPVNH